MKKIGIDGFACAHCGKTLHSEDLVEACADCGAIFCEQCVRGGEVEKHRCDDGNVEEEVD